MSDRFNKRYYRNLREFWQDFSYPFRHRDKIRQAMQGDLLSPAFRERLMLAVTAVTGCRYCVRFHAGEALKAGLSETEIRTLLDGTLNDAPAEELPALIYAQHWAEVAGNPDPDIQQSVQDAYGTELAETIEIVLRLIQTGNLLGNTIDYWKYLLSFGRWRATETGSHQS